MHRLLFFQLNGVSKVAFFVSIDITLFLKSGDGGSSRVKQKFYDLIMMKAAASRPSSTIIVPFLEMILMLVHFLAPFSSLSCAEVGLMLIGISKLDRGLASLLQHAMQTKLLAHIIFGPQMTNFCLPQTILPPQFNKRRSSRRVVFAGNATRLQKRLKAHSAVVFCQIL